MENYAQLTAQVVRQTEPRVRFSKNIYDRYALKASFDGRFSSTHPILENTTEKNLFLFGVPAMIPVNRRFMDEH
jgi:hypothetical protein